MKVNQLVSLFLFYLRSTLDNTKIQDADNKTSRHWTMLLTVPLKTLKKTVEFNSWPLSTSTNFWLAITWQ